MISNEPVITVSPEETTTYRLKVTTEKGLVDYTDIIVYVKDVLECRFDYNTGNVVSQYGTFLTKKQALSSNWNVNGSSIDVPSGKNGDILKTSLKRIHWPAGVKVIADSQFMDFTALEEIDIPDTVTAIGASAFYRCGVLNNAPCRNA